MKVSFFKRKGSNMCFYLWYKACRLFFVQLYYYFFPIFIVTLSLYVPLFLQNVYDIDPPEEFSDPYGVERFDYSDFDWSAYGDYYSDYYGGYDDIGGGGYDDYGGGGYDYGGGY